ncbi:hypothetical protein SAMN04488156_11168 [Bacillus sp. 166amftsu]|nr:hypothetical protein SAMN04488156_11168 [Bacillus sp. 166amftsu]
MSYLILGVIDLLKVMLIDSRLSNDEYIGELEKYSIKLHNIFLK